MRFVTRSDNPLAVRLSCELSRKGYEVLYLLDEKYNAPFDSVALIDIAGRDDVGRSRTHLRLAAHRVRRVAPSWAKNALYPVGVKRLSLGCHLQESIDRLVLLSARDPWRMDLDRETPWGAPPDDPENLYHYLLWRRDVVGDEAAKRQLREMELANEALASCQGSQAWIVG